MDTIFNRIKNYLDKNPSIWHTPGHKGLLSKYDITELDDSFPLNSITQAQENAAKIFGTKAVRFLTGGSSIGIKAGIMALEGDFLIESNCHGAIHEALILARKQAIIIENIIKNDLPQPITAQQIDDNLKLHKNIKTVVITSPDYYGQAANIDEIVSVTKKHNVFLYVDSAHGAHFSIRQDLFPASFTTTADACNISAHKTLPAFTQSAYLCINNQSLIPKIDQNLKLLGTTSPSYLLLSSLEFAANFCKDNSALYDDIACAIKELKNSVKCLKNDDFTRLVVDAKHYGLDGKELYFRLKNNGVTAEKFDDRYVVFIVSIVDTAISINHLKNKILEEVN